MNTHPIEIPFPLLLQEFFCQRLIAQRNVSPQAVVSYRDAFRLLLRFTQQQLNKPSTDLSLADLDAPHVLSFLDHLERERAVAIRTRNSRLAAIRSFMRYAAFRNPTALPLIQRVLAIPLKRFDRPAIEFLSREEVQAILDAANPATWSGHRDQVLFATLYNTGARVSEITGLKVAHLTLGHTPSVEIHGKGRKQRTMPLWKEPHWRKDHDLEPL